MFREFHCHGRLPRGSNASFLALIPKKECPSKLEDYRPISLIGCSYKNLAKMLANRMSKVIKSVISTSQSAFMQGSNILDSGKLVVGLCQKERGTCLMLKVDFEKAHYSVSWEFMDYMLRRIGFGGKWRLWIRECLSSASVSVLVNGSPTNEFSMSKGLRQGDPKAPFRFLIVAEGLSGLINRAVDLGIY